METARLGEIPTSGPWGPDDLEPEGRVTRLEREREALVSFTARAAHELVAPLVAIEARSTDLAGRLSPADESARRDLTRITRIAARTRRLVETLLYAASGDQGLERRPVDLGEIAADCAAMLGIEAEERGARIRIGHLPTVPGEPSLLTSLMTNLLVNALRYGPRWGARIEVSAKRERSGDWRVMVDSAGAPIDPGDSERIFEPFERGTHERRSRGSGLGLAICKEVVERHGGRIGAVAITDGNRFWFTLPAR